MLRKCVIGLAALALPGLAALAQTAAPKAPAPAAAASPAATQNVDDLIAKNIEARGGLDKMKAVKSIRMTGKMTMGQGMEAPMVLELKRPKSMRMEFTFQGMTGIQAFDGKSGWAIMPFGGKKDPEPMTAEDLQEADEESDIDGPLVDYRTKGYTVELMGKEKVEGSDAYKLKVGMKNGTVRVIYLDADTMLEIKTEQKRMIRGSEIEMESTIGDYKEVAGLLYPYSIQSGAKGRPEKQNIIIDKIEVNPALDDARYKMPATTKIEPSKDDAGKPAPAKPGTSN